MPRFRHPLTEFCAAAKPTCEIWRTLLGIVLIFCSLIAMTVLMRLGASTLMFGLPQSDASQLLGRALHETARPSSTLSLMLFIATFACYWPVLWVVVRVLHRRPGRTLWGPTGRINWKHYRIGLACSLAVGALAWMPWLGQIDMREVGLRRISDWLPLAAIGLPLLFVQTAAEELMFRGYLLQQFGARSWSIIGWSVIPSVMFAALHPGDGQPLGLNWLSLVSGLVLAAVTSRTANLGGSAGLHMGHNTVNFLLISSLQTGYEPALIVLDPEVGTRGPLLIMTAVMFVGAIIFMGRMDLKFIMAWRADPERRGQAPIKLVMPLDEKWIRAREAREAAREARREARRAARAGRGDTI